MTPPVVFFMIPFFVSALTVVSVSKRNMKAGIVGRDVNKLDGRMLPEGAGIAMLAPLWTAIFLFNALLYFELGTIALGLAVSGLCLVGFLDDRKQKFKGKTISWRKRASIIGLICLIFAYMYAPSPVWIIPFTFFIAGLASFENTFAGLNGWEIGSGLIISCFAAFILANSWVFPIALALVGAIAGLFLYNAFPARVLPGDSGTLLIGSSIAGLVILSQRIELAFLAALFFVPHAIDFFGLKLLTNPHDVSQSGKMPYAVLDDGRLSIPKNGNKRPCYDFAKMLLKIFGPMPEWLVVAVIWVAVAANCIFWILAFQYLQVI
ncbi:MAG: hypothetical protein JW744_05680 [Candidatus Diapherotrites archaeon]|uniref:Glycosyl transferase family 4 n=1 Tax=Candidatus Iainarchaeum sp. TaxID=3101447 RepID=A0A938YYC0_9ARCH|nr:hypothetical protein [Candidatus Diapherotrites archaeon]